jgi:hypothetical protein
MQGTAETVGTEGTPPPKTKKNSKKAGPGILRICRIRPIIKSLASFSLKCLSPDFLINAG